MFKATLVYSLVLLPLALSASTVESFNQKWAHTPVMKNQSGTATNETKIFKRFVWNEDLPVAVSEGVVSVVRNPEGKTDLDDLAKKIDQSFGGKMKIKSFNDKLELHGPFDKMNRTIDVTLQKKGNDFLIVTTFTRTGFYPSLKADITELHKISGDFFHKKAAPGAVVKIFNTFSDFILGSAHAQGLNLSSIFSAMNNRTGPQATNPPATGGSGSSSIIPSGLLPSSSSPGSTILPGGDLRVTVDTGALGTTISTQGDNATRAIDQAGVRVSDSITGAGTTVSGSIDRQGSAVTGAIDRQGTALTGSADRLTATIDRQASTITEVVDRQAGNLTATIDEQGTEANRNLRNLTDVAQQQGGALNGNLVEINAQANVANENWAKSNKLIAKAMDPNHMAKIAFYSAAGAALGAVTINLAIQGVSKGIGALIELITHNKQKKMEWEDFQKAMEVWDTQLNDLVQMEKTVDNFLAAFGYFQKNKALGSNYPEILKQAIRGMAMDREIFLEKFKEPNPDKACRENYFNAAAELEDKIAEYKTLLAFATGSSMVTDSPENYFCGQLSELRRKLLSSERSMQDLRLKILAAEPQYYRKQREAQEKGLTVAGKIGDRIDNSTRERERRREQLASDQQERLEDARNDFIRNCVNGKNAQGVIIVKDMFLTTKQRKDKCVAAYVAPAGFTVADVSADEEALRRDLPILGNDYIDINLSQQQQQWFTKVHVDAACYQYAHKPASEMPKKCSEFPETLYSTALTKAYNKADAAYNASCSQRYVDGIRTLAQGN